MLMKRKIINIISLFIAFSLGFTISKLTNWGYFTINKDISIIDALSLFLTIGLAIYITKILEKEVQESRIEKDLFISKICEIENSLKLIEDLIESKDASFSKLNNKIHLCRILKKSFFDSIKETFNENKNKRFLELESKVSININNLKRLLTETPIEKKDLPAVSLKKGIVNYSDNRVLEINVEINSIKDIFFKVKVNINII